MRQSKREAGSALVFALLAIVFLTVIGLSLAMVTETEMLIGANEQVSHETFVAAESGVAVALDHLIINNDAVGHRFAIPARAGDGQRIVSGRRLGYSVDTTDMYPVSEACAPRTNCAEDEDAWFSYYFAGKVRARRLAWPDDQEVPDCQTESERRATDPQTLDYFNSIQSEKTITIGFYVAPLGALSGQILEDTSRFPDHFACAPLPEKKIQRE
jgi:hypothetical protein